MLLICGCGPAAVTREALPPLPPPDPAEFSGDRAYEEAAGLVALGPRDAGTPGAARAAQHIRDRLLDLGVDAHVDSFEEDTSLGPTTFHNVIGTIPGQGPDLILLGSHFDTKRGIGAAFEGANDSASSTGALIELARLLQVHADAHGLAAEVRCVFFDGEECRVRYGPRDGFHGSKHYAAKLVREGEAGRVRGVIILDMIGDRDLTLTLPRNSDPGLLGLALDAATAEGMRSNVFLLDHDIGDDHVAFLNAGMPAIDLIDFRYGSRPGWNDYWHTEKDRMDRISAESLGKVGRMTVRMVGEVLAERGNAE